MEKSSSKLNLSDHESSVVNTFLKIDLPEKLYSVLDSYAETVKELENNLSRITNKYTDTFISAGIEETQKAITSIRFKSDINIDLPKILSDYPIFTYEKFKIPSIPFELLDEALVIKLNSTTNPESELADKLIGKDQSQIILAAEIVTDKECNKDGQLIEVVSIAWLEIYKEIERNSNFLYEFTKNPRKFEEFIAATYSKQGFDVILTPRSNDKGRDVIAERDDIGKIRIIEQCKAYSQHRKVSRSEVSDLLGVLNLTEKGASKAILTTTAEFAPMIFKDEDFIKIMPTRLELRSKIELMKMLTQVYLKYYK